MNKIIIKKKKDVSHENKISKSLLKRIDLKKNNDKNKTIIFAQSFTRLYFSNKDLPLLRMLL